MMLDEASISSLTPDLFNSKTENKTSLFNPIFTYIFRTACYTECTQDVTRVYIELKCEFQDVVYAPGRAGGVGVLHMQISMDAV